ncbi:hypothetical protein ACKWTF_011866 [Chironomus riparius]
MWDPFILFIKLLFYSFYIILNFVIIIFTSTSIQKILNAFKQEISEIFSHAKVNLKLWSKVVYGVQRIGFLFWKMDISTLKFTVQLTTDGNKILVKIQFNKRA